MKIKYIKSTVMLIILSSLFSCATHQQTEYAQYQARTNSVEKNSGEQIDVAKVTLLPENMKNGANVLKVRYATAKEIRIDNNGDENDAHVFKQGSGLLYFRGVIELDGSKPALVDWRCKFYDAHGDELYEDENNQIAHSKTGLGWHRIKVYPSASKATRHEENTFRCTALNNSAVQAQVEIHDTANDVVMYK